VCVTCDFFLLLRVRSVSEIHDTMHPGGVTGEGPAACISLRRKSVLLLKYGVTEDTVSLIDSRFHQRATSTYESCASTRRTFASDGI